MEEEEIRGLPHIYDPHHHHHIFPSSSPQVLHHQEMGFAHFDIHHNHVLSFLAPAPPPTLGGAATTKAPATTICNDNNGSIGFKPSCNVNEQVCYVWVFTLYVLIHYY